MFYPGDAGTLGVTVDRLLADATRICKASRKR